MGFPDLSGRRDDRSNSRPAPMQGIAERAESRLRSNSYLALRNVTCEYHEGILTLRGCLPSYHLKQIAQTTVAQVEGVRLVVNQIEVVAPVQREPALHG